MDREVQNKQLRRFTHDWLKDTTVFWDNNIEKSLIVALDLESDYGTGKFSCLDNAGPVVSFLKDRVKEFTVFCEGNVLRLRHPILEMLKDAGGDLQLHCNDHRLGCDNVTEFKNGLNEYVKCFNKIPDGYRAGKFKMDAPLFQTIRDVGLKWDSSLLPIFCNKKYNYPIIFKDGFVEFPASVWEGTSYPVGMSYCSLVGTTIFNQLKKNATQMLYINFTIHLHDLLSSPALQSATLVRRFMHLWNCRFGYRDPFNFFVKIINEFLALGFTPISLSSLYYKLNQSVQK